MASDEEVDESYAGKLWIQYKHACDSTTKIAEREPIK